MVCQKQVTYCHLPLPKSTVPSQSVSVFYAYRVIAHPDQKIVLCNKASLGWSHCLFQLPHSFVYLNLTEIKPKINQRPLLYYQEECLFQPPDLLPEASRWGQTTSNLCLFKIPPHCIHRGFHTYVACARQSLLAFFPILTALLISLESVVPQFTHVKLRIDGSFFSLLPQTQQVLVVSRSSIF